MSENIQARLEELRAAIDAENISYGEIAELTDLAGHIKRGDVQLLEWAGVPEEAATTADRIEDDELRAAYIRGALDA